MVGSEGLIEDTSARLLGVNEVNEVNKSEFPTGVFLQVGGVFLQVGLPTDTVYEHTTTTTPAHAKNDC